MLHSANGVLSIFVIVLAGFLASKFGFITEELERSLVRLSLVTAIPALVFYNTTAQLSAGFITEKLRLFIFLPAVSILFAYALARALARVIRLPPAHHGAMSVLFSMSNTMFIGLPLCAAIFGEWTTPYIMSFLLSNTVVFWTLGNLSMAGVPLSDARGHLGWKQLAANVMPPLSGFLVGLPVALLGVPIPDFFMSAARMLGGMATPVVLLIVGGVLSRMKKPRITKTVAAALLGRYIVTPLITFAMCRFTGAPNEVVVVFTFAAAMPVMNQAVMVARKYDNCVEEVTQAFALSVLGSLAVVPLLAFILGRAAPV
ncbi:MAG: AEC family transporter [Oscillospiraceae bacterium]|nr:AEC family transporter [Oscillospiraceae bacterium]